MYVRTRFSFYKGIEKADKLYDTYANLQETNCCNIYCYYKNRV